MPSEKRKRIETIDEIEGFLEQSNISPQNIRRLEVLSKSDNHEIQSLAALVLEVAKAHSRKRKRLKFLAQNQRDLYDRLKEKGFIEDDSLLGDENDFVAF
jgi:hypothetical protein